jgi:Amt family ammonium transporter
MFGQTVLNHVSQWNGLFYGDVKLFIAQIMSIVITIIFAGGMTFLIIKVMKMFMDIRVDSSEEADGLDVAEHGESAYPSFNGLD